MYNEEGNIEGGWDISYGGCGVGTDALWVWITVWNVEREHGL
jgi:hypothetical protein